VQYRPHLRGPRGHLSGLFSFGRTLRRYPEYDIDSGRADTDRSIATFLGHIGLRVERCSDMRDPATNWKFPASLPAPSCEVAELGDVGPLIFDDLLRGPSAPQMLVDSGVSVADPEWPLAIRSAGQGRGSWIERTASPSTRSERRQDESAGPDTLAIGVSTLAADTRRTGAARD